MTPERWRRITEVFHATLAREPGARGALLDEACAGDPALRAEVDAMLAAHREAGSFGEGPPLAVSGEEAPRLGRGAALGPYRIEALIGAGGMGEVYRAHDTRLDRDVAVKVLPSHVASEPHWKQRLEREARALAALSHPHICPVFDIGEQDGVEYLVMEYLEGETLADRLAKGPVPLRQTLRWAIEIAGALDAAHRRSLVHRDLKPGNIMLTKSGARLLDFGLARLRPSPAEAAERAHTPGSSLTGEGRIVGTLHYMAPEQLRGEPADARSDVFAFGVVVYEMVTGRRVFEASSPAGVIAAILEHEPAPISTLSPTAPPALDHLVGTCLAKDPDQRWQSAGDLERNLKWLLADGSQPGVTAQGVRPPAAAMVRSRMLWLATAALGLLASLGLAWLMRARDSVHLLQSVLTAPPGVQLDPRRGFALSPDGRYLAFVGQDSAGARLLWVRPLASLEARPLPGTEGAFAPFWSPDGRDIGYFGFRDALVRVPAAGGAVQILARGVTQPKGGTWSSEGRIVYVPDYRTGLFEVPANGGTPRALTTLDADSGELSHRWPQFLPDGRTLVFLVQTSEAGARNDQSRIEALEDAGARHELLRTNASAAYAPPGRLLFWREGSIYAQELDARQFRLRGEASQLAGNVGLTLNEWSTFTVSTTGTLVYAEDPAWRLEWRQRSGRLLSVAAPEGHYSHPALSADGNRVAYVADNLTVRVRDLVRGTDSRVTFEEVDHFSPTWTPQGDWVAYSANKPGQNGTDICRRRASGLGEREVLHSSESVVRVLSWSPDSRWIVFGQDPGDIFLLDVESKAARPRLSTPAFESSPAFSPDGRWLAYTSDESGRDEVYVVSAFEGPGKWQVSSQGGYAPRWGPGGSELFFEGLDYELHVVKVDLGNEPEFGLPEPLFALLKGASGRRDYDIGRDGRILVNAQEWESLPGSLRLVVNWPRLLEEPSR
jgi:Tol biopolymer transport system component/predicted Ser/Thr protein kinase